MTDPLAVLRHRCPHMPGERCDCPDKDEALAAVERLVEAARAAVDRAETLHLIGFGSLAAALALFPAEGETKDSET